VAAYGLLCLVVGLRSRARRGAMQSCTQAVDGTTPLLVAHASQTGTAEELAAQTVRALATAGVPATLQSFAQLEPSLLSSLSQALFIVSTYGEGDAPDVAAHFVASMDASLDLSRLHYGLLALGDRRYRSFCGFGRELDTWLQSHGARPLAPRIEVDGGDEASLQRWRHNLSHIAGTADLPDWQGAPFDSWTLRARRHLNPGSLGGAVYHIELASPHPACGWEAGDLLQLEVPADPGRPREYSIASLPTDGVVQLLVRLERHADGSHGLASGWLTQAAPEGAPVRARLRAHSHFRIGHNRGRDLILIGNGTGLAGLRSHLRQRAAQRDGATTRRHWLIFGERQAAHDVYYADELRQWQSDGLLTRLDLVYSRDGHTERYVQDRLRAESDRVRSWLDAGAAIYVCGSLQGMAAEVDAVLQQTLGAGLAELQRQGRYRRDVY